MLTQRQSDLLRFIHKHSAEKGIAPTFSEMCDGVGINSKAYIYRLLEGLEERGFIRRLQNRNRAIEILRLPEQSSDISHCPLCGAALHSEGCNDAP